MQDVTSADVEVLIRAYPATEKLRMDVLARFMVDIVAPVGG